MSGREKLADSRDREFNELLSAFGLPPVRGSKEVPPAHLGYLRWRTAKRLAGDGVTVRQDSRRPRTSEEYLRILRPCEREDPDCAAAIIELWHRWHQEKYPSREAVLQEAAITADGWCGAHHCFPSECSSRTHVHTVRLLNALWERVAAKAAARGMDTNAGVTAALEAWASESG